MNVKKDLSRVSIHKHSFSNSFITIAAFLLFLCFLAISYATVQNILAISHAAVQNDGPKTSDKTPDQIISVMKDRLGLTEEQEAQIRPIMEEHIKKRDVIVQKYKGQGRQGRRSLRNELQELRKATENQLEMILTEEQMKEYRKLQEEERQKVRERMRRGSMPRGF